MDYEQEVAVGCEGEIRRIDTNGISTDALVAGEGPAMLLLHGWPHTWLIWHALLPALAAKHTVIAPDLRGLGAATRPDGGYDPHTLADDAAGVLDAVGLEQATVVGVDAGAPAAWMLARRRPERVARLVVMESLMGRLPGAEAFLTGGPPWWFGFHTVPGLAERVLAGHEGDYLDFFFSAGTHGGHRRALPTARSAARWLRALPRHAARSRADRGGRGVTFPGPNPGHRRRRRGRHPSPATRADHRRPHRPRHPGVRTHRPGRPTRRAARVPARATGLSSGGGRSSVGHGHRADGLPEAAGRMFVDPKIAPYSLESRREAVRLLTDARFTMEPTGGRGLFTSARSWLHLDVDG